MDLRHLQSFYHVARLNSISGASDYLGVSKSLLSRHIAGLEQELGAQLLHRTTRSVTLSDAGARLFQRAEQIAILAVEAQSEVQDWSRDVSGGLRFTCPLSLGDKILPDLLEEFRAFCPNVRVEVQLSNSAFQIIDGDQDIAIRAGGDIHPDMVAKDLGWLRNIIAASPDYIKQHGPITSIEDLRNKPAILFSHNRDWNQWTLLNGEDMQKVHVTGDVTVSHYSSALILGQRSQGMVNLPAYLLEDPISEGCMVAVLTDYVPRMHRLSILYAKHRRLPKKLQIFRDCIMRWFAQKPHLTL